MNYVKMKAILALVSGLAATVLVLLSLSISNTQAATLMTNSTSGSDSSVLREYESLVQDPSTVVATPIQTGTVSCLDDSGTLTDLIDCIHGYMPDRADRDHRDGFVTPTVTAKTQWISVVTQMMNARCDDIDLSEYGWGGDFTVRTFTDTQNNRPYCVFMEITYGIYIAEAITRVTRGWGTFIYNPNYSRDLNISAPHPRHDLCTDDEAIGIFENTQSRTFLMAGTHRDANDTESLCQPGEMESDAAHNSAHTFQATIEALKEYYYNQNSEFYHLQFHGKGASSCQEVDVYMTHGVSTTPVMGDKILELKSNLLEHNPKWTMTVPGDDPYCNLHGSENVQGRLLNGVPITRVCNTSADDYSGSFLHIEQRLSTTQKCLVYRNPDNWFPAINDTWAPSLTVTIQANPDPVRVGGPLTYTLRVTNTGETLLHLSITDTLSIHVTPTGVLTWMPDPLPPGGVWIGTVTVTVEPCYVGPLTNVVQVTTEEGAADAYTKTVFSSATLAAYQAWFGLTTHIQPPPYISTDTTIISGHITAALSRGIDGFVVDWYGPEAGVVNDEDRKFIDEATAELLRQAGEREFCVALMYDEGAVSMAGIPTTTYQSRVISDLLYARRYFTMPGYLRIAGYPSLFVFPYDAVEPYIDWAEVRNQLGVAITLIDKDPDPLDPDHDVPFDGFYTWVKPDEQSTDGTNWGKKDLTWFYNTMDTPTYTDKITIGGVWPGFDETLAPWPNRGRYIWRRCGQTWRDTWSIAAQYNPLIVMIVTWNDFEEGTDIEYGIGECLMPSRQQTVLPGRQAVYTHAVVNTGKFTDTFSIATDSSNMWPVVRDPMSVTLLGHISATLVVSLTVPETAVSGTWDRLTITATSGLSIAVHSSVVDTTTVIKHCIYLPLVMRNS